MIELEEQSSGKFPNSVLIVGCGYIGTALAEQLLKVGVKVGALTRNVRSADTLRKMGLEEVVVADLDSDLWHEQLNLKYQAVVNCVSSAGGGLVGYEKSYVQGQKSLLSWAEQMKPEIICYTSSTSVYPQDGGVWVDESAETEPATKTAALLLKAERLLLENKVWAGRRYVLRLGGIYGPGRHYLIDQIKNGEQVLSGHGQHHLNIIHRDDAVSGILAILNKAFTVPCGIYNVCDGQPAQKSEIVGWIADALKVSCPQFNPKLMTDRLQRRGGKMPDRKICCRKLGEVSRWQIAYPNYKIGYSGLL
ncbi:MAG: NAD-dependent epimerase/dehydratase family protein [Verrucomicrobia bacterium]|nr:NAD-dependent epimerase/dehydratase family protein [Verrucomicrobiota bacterium]